MKMIERILIITRRTRLEELIIRFNTVSQAKFFLKAHKGYLDLLLVPAQNVLYVLLEKI